MKMQPKKRKETDLRLKTEPLQPEVEHQMSVHSSRFNCISVSPTIQEFLQNDKATLPHRRDKRILHKLEHLEQHSLRDKIAKQEARDKDLLSLTTKKPQATVKKPPKKRLQDIYDVKVTYDYKVDMFPNYFKEMEEHYHIFRKHTQKVTNFPSRNKHHASLQVISSPGFSPGFDQEGAQMEISRL